MSYCIRFAAPAGLVIEPTELPPDGAYLEKYDPEAFDGRGAILWTNDPRKALRFAEARLAFECWRAVPQCRPRRPDGKPNRPMTAFTVSVERAPEEGASSVSDQPAHD